MNRDDELVRLALNWYIGTRVGTAASGEMKELLLRLNTECEVTAILRKLVDDDILLQVSDFVFKDHSTPDGVFIKNCNVEHFFNKYYNMQCNEHGYVSKDVIKKELLSWLNRSFGKFIK